MTRRDMVSEVRKKVFSRLNRNGNRFMGSETLINGEWINNYQENYDDEMDAMINYRRNFMVVYLCFNEKVKGFPINLMTSCITRKNKYEYGMLILYNSLFYESDLDKIERYFDILDRG